MSAKLFKNAGGTKPVVIGGMKFRGMSCLQRVKRITRKVERRDAKLAMMDTGLDPIVSESAKPALLKATVGELGVTGYTSTGRVFLE